MDELPDPADPGQPASDDDDDSGQILGHFDTDAHDEEGAVREDRFLNSSLASPVTADEPDDLVPPDARDGGHEEENASEPATVPFDDDGDDGEDSDDEEIKKLEAEANVASDEENEDASAAPAPNSGTADGQLIADIFGESDSEDEGFEGFKRETTAESEAAAGSGQAGDVDPSHGTASSSDEEEDDKNRSRQSDIVYDFDLMMQKKRDESYRRRKRKNTDIINDSDDLIADMITQMKQAADDDFEYNKVRRPATCKLKLLPRIEDPLRKIDLREALLDSGILSVITDWLTPLPDRSLPNIRVREVMLQVLLDFNISDTDRLKASGIGKAVMYLYKHPKETKENKARAQRLIQAWSRPIFNNDVDFHSMSKEEREERDKRLIEKTREAQAKRARTSSESPVKKTSNKTPAPGEKGWVPRARVPQPSAKDYVNRPRSSAEVDMGRGSSKKIVTRYEMMQRQFNEKKKSSKVTGVIKVSIEGRKM